MAFLTSLFSRVRAEILSALFSADLPAYHLRELARRGHLSAKTVQVELTKLEAMGLVKSRRDGNRRYFEAAPDHPAFTPLCALVQQRSTRRAASPPRRSVVVDLRDELK